MKHTAVIRPFMTVLLATGLAGFSCSCAGQTSPVLKRQPNIIYIYADDLGYGELGSYGQTKIATPHLDQMAREGMRFTRHYSGSPVCAPARAMLLTGLHAGHAPIRGNHELGGFADSAEKGQMPLPDTSFTVAKMLRSRGYATALIGKWGLGMPFNGGSPLRHGFDQYYGYLDQKQAHNHYPSHLWHNDRWDTLRQPWMNVHRSLQPSTATNADFDAFTGTDYAPQQMTEHALRFISDNKSRPFFLYLPYTLPHLSLQVPPEYLRPYLGRFPEKPYYGQHGYAATRYPMSTYAAMITFLDAQVGMILKQLKDLGLDEETLVCFSSDNGATFSAGVDATYFNSAGGLRGLKMDLYEGGIRIPFLARWPGKIAAGTTSDLLSAQYDFPATMADLLGVPAPPGDGISMLPTLMGQPGRQQKHRWLYFEFSEKSGQIAVCTKTWKAVKSNLRKDSHAPWELYDLSADPSEEHNVAASHPRIIRKMNTIAKQAHQHPVLQEWEIADDYRIISTHGKTTITSKLNNGTGE